MTNTPDTAEFLPLLTPVTTDHYAHPDFEDLTTPGVESLYEEMAGRATTLGELRSTEDELSLLLKSLPIARGAYSAWPYSGAGGTWALHKTVLLIPEEERGNAWGDDSNLPDPSLDVRCYVGVEAKLSNDIFDELCRAVDAVQFAKLDSERSGNQHPYVAPANYSSLLGVPGEAQRKFGRVKGYCYRGNETISSLRQRVAEQLLEGSDVQIDGHALISSSFPLGLEPYTFFRVCTKSSNSLHQERITPVQELPKRFRLLGAIIRSM